MKRFLFAAIAALSLAACSTKPQNAYTVEGVAGPRLQDGDSVRMVNRMTGAVVGSAAVKEGAFTIEGTVDSTCFVSIAVDRHFGCQFFLEPGVIKVNLEDASAKGTPLNDDLQAYSDALEQATPENGDSLDFALSKQLYENHKHDILGRVIFQSYAYYLDYNELKAVLDEADDDIKNDINNQASLQNKKQQEATAAGVPYTNIEGPSMSKIKVGKLSLADNQVFSIADMLALGKPLVVDFWASWCGPCQREINDYLAPYAKQYAGKVNFLSIAVWEKAEANTREAMAKLPITWPVLYNKDAATPYGIEAIPHILLIDANGTIVARGLRGEAIAHAIDQLLAQ